MLFTIEFFPVELEKTIRIMHPVEHSTQYPCSTLEFSRLKNYVAYTMLLTK